jgi:uncharacterized protein
MSKVVLTIEDLPKPFNILSLDGGGIQGAIEAVILERLHQTSSKFLRNIDLLVGTSTGAIQALGIAAGFTPPEVRGLYEDVARHVFSDSSVEGFRDLWELSAADYSNKHLRSVLQKQFGDMRLGVLSKRVAILTFDLDNGQKDAKKRTWQPKIFHNIDGSGADPDALVVDVALAASATPVYFPTYQGLIDGGVVASNPAMVGIAQAMNSRGIGKALDKINLLSIGAGASTRFIKGNNHDWGVLQWAPYLLFLLLEGGTSLVDFQCKQLLGRRYHRINPPLNGKFSLDEWRKVPKLVEIADDYELDASIEWLKEYWV